MLIQGPVAIVLELPVLVRWDDRLGFPILQPFTQFGAVVPLVGNQMVRWRHGVETCLRCLVIAYISGRQKQDVGMSQAIAHNVDLGRPPAIAAAKTMSSRAPFAPPRTPMRLDDGAVDHQSAWRLLGLG